MPEPTLTHNPPNVTHAGEAIDFLKKLIAIPSFSREENHTADLIEKYLQQKEIKTSRKGNNVWAMNKYYDPSLPSILLNSHHDTVKPNSGYTLDPFTPIEKRRQVVWPW